MKPTFILENSSWLCLRSTKTTKCNNLQNSEADNDALAASGNNVRVAVAQVRKMLRKTQMAGLVKPRRSRVIPVAKVCIGPFAPVGPTPENAAKSRTM